MIHHSYTQADIPAAYDYCVVGYGPSAVILVTQLVKRGVRNICVLESGGQQRHPEAASLQRVIAPDLPIKPHSRERIIGGATETWTGQYAVMDDVDFATKPTEDTTEPAWPLTRADLAPYYERVSSDYGLYPYQDFYTDPDTMADSWFGRLVAGSSCMLKQFILDLPREQYGKLYSYIFNSVRPDIFLYTSAARIRTTATGATVYAHTATGEAVQFTAKTVVLAGGAIENARLLLNSPTDAGHSLGNEHDQVGRYFMNRLKGMAGEITFPAPLTRSQEPTFRFYVDRFEGYYGLRLSDQTQAAQQVGNHYLMLLPQQPWHQSAAYQRLARTTTRTRKALRQLRYQPSLGSLRQCLALAPQWLVLLPHLPAALQQVAKKKRQGTATTERVRIRNFVEVLPDRENRVTMTDETDCYGVPIPHVSYQFRHNELGQLRALHQAAGELVATAGGTLVVDEAEYQQVNEDSSHHLGTTRMGVDPATSVITPDLQLHGDPRVYVLGGSVFPTSGIANPTYTMLALAARLAEHLYEKS